MFRFVQHMLLYTAWVILFAHSVVPHAHQSDTDSEFCAAANNDDSNILDVLIHLFHFSTGEDHLEDYRSGVEIVHFLVSNPAISINLQPKTTDFVTEWINSPAENEQVAYSPLRAPPVYS